LSGKSKLTRKFIGLKLKKHLTDKNHRQLWRGRQTFFPGFLRMRMFLSKWEHCCQNGRIVRPFWQKYSHSERVGEHFLSFSQNFPMIFVSVCLCYRPREENLNEIICFFMFFLCRSSKHTDVESKYAENTSHHHSACISDFFPKIEVVWKCGGIYTWFLALCLNWEKSWENFVKILYNSPILRKKWENFGKHTKFPEIFPWIFRIEVSPHYCENCIKLYCITWLAR